jgi:GTPase SAR1 family protein
MSLTSTTVERFQFRHPTTGVIVGRSQVGKSSLVLNIIKHKDQLFDKRIHVIIYIYQHWQKDFDEFKDSVVFMKQIPENWDQSINLC